MKPTVSQLLAQITALEDELRTALREQETHLFYQIKGKRVEFEDTIRQTHRKLKRRIFRWITTDRPQNLITGPVIYSLALPLLILDCAVTLYQALCFPIYKIAKVRRRDYLVFDRHFLAYLNAFERFHCTYCAYATGLLAYTSEVAARTEQYFCPIKHAHRIVGTHGRYERFLPYGEATDYHARVNEFRLALANEKPQPVDVAQ
jgi:hypothetical protein